MLRRILRYIGAILLALVLGTVVYEHARAYHPATERAAMLSRGREIYTTICHNCHGDHMEGHAVPGTDLVAPPLNKPGFRVFFYLMPHDMEGFVAGLVDTGRGGMPSFGAMIAPQDRRCVALLIHDVNTGATDLK